MPELLVRYPDDDVTVTVFADFFEPVINKLKFKVLNIKSRILDLKLTHTVKRKSYASAGTQTASAFSKVHAHICDRPRRVVSSSFYQYRNPVWSISFI